MPSHGRHVMTEAEVDDLMASVPENARHHWCEAPMCCCIGCVNKTWPFAPKKGLTKQEWLAWKSRQEQRNDR